MRDESLCYMTEADIALLEMVLDRDLILRGESIKNLPDSDPEAYHLLVGIFGMQKKASLRAAARKGSEG